jgi:hypothetical protein
MSEDKKPVGPETLIHEMDNFNGLTMQIKSGLARAGVYRIKHISECESPFRYTSGVGKNAVEKFHWFMKMHGALRYVNNEELFFSTGR